jgi:hypothetical protein
VSERARRWDAGKVVITERDLTVLTVMGEQYGLRDDALGLLLSRLSPAAPDRLTPEGLSGRTARGWAARMERGGYLTRRRIIGRVWLTPTQDGLDLAGLPFERWNFGGRRADEEPSGWGLRHVHAITVVRLELEAAHPGAVWTPEREFHRQRQEAASRVRVPDGALDLDDGQRVGVEVELSRKRPDRYRTILRDAHRSLDRVRWYVPPRLRPWLESTLEATSKPARPVVEVVELPEGAL